MHCTELFNRGVLPPGSGDQLISTGGLLQAGGGLLASASGLLQAGIGGLHHSASERLLSGSCVGSPINQQPPESKSNVVIRIEAVHKVILIDLRNQCSERCGCISRYSHHKIGLNICVGMFTGEFLFRPIRTPQRSLGTEGGKKAGK